MENQDPSQSRPVAAHPQSNVMDIRSSAKSPQPLRAAPSDGVVVPPYQAPEPNQPAPKNISEQPDQAQPRPEHKNQKPVAVVMIAVFAALSLVGLAVFAYLRSQDTTTHQDGHTETTQEPTTSDVDDVEQEVNETVDSVDDAQDLSEDGLSDQMLGL